MPRISVLMPVFNCDTYLPSSLDSILAQTYADFEIIAVDDGSTDSSGALLDQFATRDGRIRVFHTSNHGIVSALNLAAAQAGGEFLARMDGDDVAHPERFALQVRALDNAPACVCTGSLCREIDKDSHVIGMPGTSRFRQTDLTVFPPVVASPPHPTIMMRAALFNKIGGYRPYFPHAEDHDLFLRLSRHGIIDIVQAYLLDYRIHSASISASRLDVQTDSALMAELSAVLVQRGNLDLVPGGRPLSRFDYYKAIDDAGYCRLFEEYRQFRLVRSYIDRRERRLAARRLLPVLLRLSGDFPKYVADRRYYCLLYAVAAALKNLLRF